jgi:glycosyltransferase involved in cell wall biosynthesis
MKILQINTTVNSGSTGRIAEDIGKVLIVNGHESYIAFGRGNQKSQSQLIRIGNKLNMVLHLLITRLFDRHGFGSKRATKQLLKDLDKIKPDAIGLHNIHGYYLNIQVLFDYIAKKKIPVIWTFHDCWAFTSSSEGFPNVIGEAMSASLPVVAYDCVAGPSDLIDHKKNGFLVDVHDKIAFKSDLEKLINDEHFRLKMGQNAKEKINQFSIEHIAVKFEKCMMSESITNQ